MTKPFGLLADLHLHAWSSFATTTPEGLNSRLVGLLDEIERAAVEVKAAGGDTLIFAGDVFHVRGSVKPTVFNPTRDRLQKIGRELSVRVIIMSGNHDLEGRDSTRLGSSVTGLEMPADMDGDGGVKVFADLTTCYIGGQAAVLVPWVENIEQLKDQLINFEATWRAAYPHVDPKHMLKRAECDLILHAPIDGVIEGLPAHGLDPEFLAGLGFKRVFAGHYHNHKCMNVGTVLPGGGQREFVWSIGALAHHTWSDVGSRAGFLIVHEDRVDYRKSHLPAFIDLSKLAATIEEEEIPLIVDKNYVRVRVEAEKAKDVEAARKELMDMGALAVLVEATPKAPVRDGTARPTAAAGASLEVSVGDFVKTMKELGDDEERRQRAAREALDVLTTAGAEA